MWIEYYNFYRTGFMAFCFPLVGLILAVILYLVIKAIKRKGVRDPERSPLVGLYIAGGFVSFWTIAAFMILGADYVKCWSAMHSKEYDVVEGMVTNFHPLPPGGHEHERFSVNNIEFNYSNSEITPGFNKIRSHGGPIDTGKYVRIYYKGNTILMLWVRE